MDKKLYLVATWLEFSSDLNASLPSFWILSAGWRHPFVVRALARGGTAQTHLALATVSHYIAAST
jgi:hypothetical protein